jgi:hypothetical protein
MDICFDGEQDSGLLIDLLKSAGGSKESIRNLEATKG